ncbi:MAG TPA: DUF2505 family protein [Acidimicrobiales bacterium]|nr:DUF2505 family protein [Acidimicrobiales bacterium]
MRFAFEHRFPAGPTQVLGAMIDPDFYRTLALPDLSLPEVVSARDDGERGSLALRYTFTGHLDPIAAALLGGGELLWLQEVTVDRPRGRASLQVSLERQPERLHAEGGFRLEETADGALRRLEGDLVVGVPLVGPRAERLILGGFSTRLDLEAAALATAIATATDQP